jgi:hypothetical protein
MKKIFNKSCLLVLVLLGSFIACKDDEIIAGYKDAYASFDRASATLPESTVVSSAAKVDTKVGAQLNVNVVRSNISEAQVVNFTLSGKFAKTTSFAAAGDDASSTYYVSAAGSNGNYSIEIPAGQASGTFFIRSNDDLFSSGDKVITIEITGAGSLKLGQGASAVNKKLTVTIVDDDCPIDVTKWVGLYSVKEVFSPGGTNAGLTLAGAFGRTFEIQLALDPNQPTDGSSTRLIASNAAGASTFFQAAVGINFITCTKEVRFDNGNPMIQVNPAQFVAHSTSITYSESTFEIKAASGPIGNFGPYEWTLKKK